MTAEAHGCERATGGAILSVVLPGEAGEVSPSFLVSLPSEAGEVSPSFLVSLPSEAGEVSPSYGDGGVMGTRLVAHDPSVREDADTSPASLGRRTEKRAPAGMSG